MVAYLGTEVGPISDLPGCILKTGDRTKSSGPVSELKYSDFVRSGPVRLRYIPDDNFDFKVKISI